MTATPSEPSKGPLRVPLESIREGVQRLNRETAVYVTRVHRLVPGDRLLVFDPEVALEADAEIGSIARDDVTIAIGPVRRALHVARRAITLIQGVGKGDKVDSIVRDATELGATRIVPAICERSIARPDEARSTRWRRIAVEAARQCGRGDAPTISPPTSFEAAVRDAMGDAPMLGACMDPRATRKLEPLLSCNLMVPLVFAVGPEGGLSKAELAVAEEAGFVRVSLGPFILRTETVCAAVLGAALVLAEQAREAVTNEL